jgi:pimeloyl-ACP methyl ester carboxylesterase
MALDYSVHLPDGYVARDYTGFYGGSPWDVREEGGEYDFGAYFRELVSHIDGAYRTLTSRRSRATSGLSMGGFFSLYLSARYPDLIGSASAFNPGPEFYVGEKGRRMLWRPKDHVGNHTRTMVRLIRASGDFISQYHEETRDAYARADDVAFEYRRDEYHRHWATSIAETFDFHMRAFANSTLDNVAEVWSHTDAYPDFEVWNYHVRAEGAEPGFTCLEDVNQTGLRLTTRRWAPDGPPIPGRHVTITTAPLYKNNWYRAKVYSDSPRITEVADLQEEKQLEWTGAKQRTSVIRLAPDTPPGTRIPLPLDNESWSYTWTPDVRYGTERLYQAFQFHSHYLHRYELVVLGKP